MKPFAFRRAMLAVGLSCALFGTGQAARAPHTALNPTGAKPHAVAPHPSRAFEPVVRPINLMPADPDSDGTRTRHWTTDDGLRVITRNVPGVHTAVVALSYRLGSRDDPKGREGLAELLAQIAITARAGDVPERSLSELDQLRPAGWSIKVNPYVSVIAEASPTELLPGVLHQVCQRLTGLAISDSLVRRSITDVRRRLRENYDTRADRALYFLTGELTSGRTPDEAMRYATGDGLEHETAAAARQMLAQRLAPANAILCVVGELSGIDVRRLVGHDLAGVASGTAAPPIPWGQLKSAQARVVRSDLKEPVGVVAILAPALTDSLHPYFTAFTLSAGSQMNAVWGKPSPPLTLRFQYSIATDPEIARFYPPLGKTQLDPAAVLSSAFDGVGNTIVEPNSVAKAAESLVWLLGGPMPPELLKRATTDPTVVHTLATTLASLEHYGDAAFWTRYRQRLMRAVTLDVSPLFRYYDDAHRQVTFVMMPGS